MLIAMPLLASTPVKAWPVNCEPWSVLKISGLPTANAGKLNAGTRPWRQIDAFVEQYNNARYHESIDNVPPADVFFGRAEQIIAERKRIKRVTIANRRLQHQMHAA